jgi:hypothetical protein
MLVLLNFIMFHSLLFELASLEGYMRVNLEDVLQTPAVDEWIGTLVEPLRARLRQLKKDAEAQMLLGARVRGYDALI